MALPRIAVVATGGTIVAAGGSPTRTTLYELGAGGIGELVAALPALAEVAEIRAEQLANLPSHELDVATLLRLAGRVGHLLAAEGADEAVDGVVVTHGTDTLEETAYFLNLVVKTAKPVVLVGATRPSTALSADGPLNLLNAVRLACSPQAWGQGVLVVLNDRVAAARFVTKGHTSAPDAFRSPEQGFLGAVTGEAVTLDLSPRRRHTAATPFGVAGLTGLPPVDIVYACLGMDARPIDAAAAAGARGVVFAASGNGSLPGVVREAALRCRAVGVAFVRSSRVGSGVVSPRPDDADLGTVAAGSLNPQKARILLMLALTLTRDRAEIQRLFDEC